MDKSRRREYDATVINWSRLEAYAKRVARETKRQPTQISVLCHAQVSSTTKSLFGMRSHTSIEMVATQRVLCDECWTLDHKTATWEREMSQDPKYRCQIRTEHIYRGLESDGSLFSLRFSEFKIIDVTARPIEQTRIDSEPSKGAMDKGDVMSFDFQTDYWSHEDRVGGHLEKVTRDDIWGKQLRYHAKGVGLSKKLSELVG